MLAEYDQRFQVFFIAFTVKILYPHSIQGMTRLYAVVDSIQVRIVEKESCHQNHVTVFILDLSSVPSLNIPIEHIPLKQKPYFCLFEKVFHASYLATVDALFFT